MYIILYIAVSLFAYNYKYIPLKTKLKDIYSIINISDKIIKKINNIYIS